MLKNSVKKLFNSCKATVSIEYGLALALLGLIIALSFTDAGRAIHRYMFCITIGGCSTTTGQSGSAPSNTPTASFSASAPSNTRSAPSNTPTASFSASAPSNTRSASSNTPTASFSASAPSNTRSAPSNTPTASFSASAPSNTRSAPSNTPTASFSASAPSNITALPDSDPLIAAAIAIIRREQTVSITSIQQQLQINFNRATLIIEELEEKGIITAADQTGRRELIN